MRLRPILALVAVAVALALLSVSGPVARGATVRRGDRERVAAEVERELRTAYDFENPDVAERLLALYGDTGSVVSAAGGRMLTSRDSLAAGIRYFWENVGRNMQQAEWVWDSLAVDVLSSSAAVVTGTYRVPHLNPRGEPHEIGGAITAVFVHDGARWRIVQEHLSDLPAGVAPVDEAGLRDDGRP